MEERQEVIADLVAEHVCTVDMHQGSAHFSRRQGLTEVLQHMQNPLSCKKNGFLPHAFTFGVMPQDGWGCLLDVLILNCVASLTRSLQSASLTTLWLPSQSLRQRQVQNMHKGPAIRVVPWLHPVFCTSILLLLDVLHKPLGPEIVGDFREPLQHSAPRTNFSRLKRFHFIYSYDIGRQPVHMSDMHVNGNLYIMR